MIMTSRSLLCWALWIFADGDSVRPPISTLQYSHNKPALLELADCPRTLHPRGHMISPEGGRTAQTLLPGMDPPPRGAITRPDTEASHVAVLPGFIFSTPRSLLDFFDSLLHPVSDEILILCELFVVVCLQLKLKPPTHSHCSPSNSAAYLATVLFKLWCFFLPTYVIFNAQ